MDQNRIKASILIRAYNAEATIARALEGALAQDFGEPYEVIVVEDGSTDDTAAIVERSLGEKRVRLIKQKNKGAAAAANVAFKSALGGIVVLLDADDEALPILLRAVSAPLLAEPNLAYTYPDYYEEYKGSRKLIQPNNPFGAIAGGMAWRTDKLLAEGGFAEDTIFPEYELLLRMWNQWKGAHVAAPVMIYHRSQESLASNEKHVRESVEALKRKYPSLVDEIEKIRSYAL